MSVFLLVITLTSGYAQVVTKTKQHEFSVTEGVEIDLTSKYTNIEFEFTDDNVVTINAIMQIEGLPENEAESYFKKWNLKANKYSDKVVISSVLQDNSDVEYNKKGHYQGYFLDANKSMIKGSEKKGMNKNSESSSIMQMQGEFDFDAYIEKGNVYLEQWEKENKEKIGRRFYNRTKEDRIKLRKPKKESLPGLENKPVLVNKPALKNKSKLPSANVRALSKRTIINKTLKIKAPRKAKLSIKARHGKVVFSGEVKNLIAELSYVLLEARKISGEGTSIKGSYSNFEIDYWSNGNLDVVFSGYTLIKEVSNIAITSSDSTVSIDNVTESIDARGNFKMLSIDTSAEVKYVNVDVEDSKKVWLKLPKTDYNFQYKGIDSRLIHPEKFVLKASKGNPRKQTIESKPLKDSESIVNIKSLSSVMQIYDIPWENLKIKSLQE
jgi:hypothetical protein